MTTDPMDLPDDETPAWEPVLPFVTVASRGGPHDDVSYVAGWECGHVDARLAALVAAGGVATETLPLHEENVPQLELIAMKHGFTLTRMDPPDGRDSVEGWLLARFAAAGEEAR